MFGQKDVLKLAQLSRLNFNEQQMVQLGQDLASIVTYIEGLQRVDVNGVEPMTHAVPIELELRQDVAMPVVGREGVMGSKGYEDGLVRVPKIIE